MMHFFCDGSCCVGSGSVYLHRIWECLSIVMHVQLVQSMRNTAVHLIVDAQGISSRMARAEFDAHYC